jgi:hypothetical protein
MCERCVRGSCEREDPGATTLSARVREGVKRALTAPPSPLLPPPPDGPHLLGVLAGHVDRQLQVLLGVDREQLLEALERPVLGQGAEELDQGLG